MELLNRENVAFWDAIDELVATSRIVLDRPMGTAHPRFASFIYPLDYGYLKGTTAGDGDGIDVWSGTAKGAGVTGIACTVDRFKRDAELKILLDCSGEDFAVISRFLNATARLPCVIVCRAG